jgi:hypothetical protein
MPPKLGFFSRILSVSALSEKIFITFMINIRHHLKGSVCAKKVMPGMGWIQVWGAHPDYELAPKQPYATL